MTYTLACKDTGMPSCPYVARAENEEQLMKDAGAHAKTVHGYTDEQLNDPELITTLKKPFKIAKHNVKISCVAVDINEKTGKADSIERIFIHLSEPARYQDMSSS